MRPQAHSSHGRQPARASVCRQPALTRQAGGLFTALAVMLCLHAPQAWAAGGHHAVDDAALLDPGQCQVELWQERSASGHTSLNHVGPACRWGALEWGFNVDELRSSDQGRQTFVGPQVKWATPLTDQISAGLAVASTWNSRDTRYTGTSVVVPVTWQATSTLAVHLNAGVDQHPSASTQSRRGLAAEWTPSAHWSFVTERFDDHGERRWRAGARYLLNDKVSLDLSRAAHLGPDSRAWWAFGINWAFSPGAR